MSAEVLLSQDRPFLGPSPEVVDPTPRPSYDRDSSLGGRATEGGGGYSQQRQGPLSVAGSTTPNKRLEEMMQKGREAVGRSPEKYFLVDCFVYGK